MRSKRGARSAIVISISQADKYQTWDEMERRRKSDPGSHMLATSVNNRRARQVRPGADATVITEGTSFFSKALCGKSSRGSHKPLMDSGSWHRQDQISRL